MSRSKFKVKVISRSKFRKKVISRSNVKTRSFQGQKWRSRSFQGQSLGTKLFQGQGHLKVKRQGQGHLKVTVGELRVSRSKVKVKVFSMSKSAWNSATNSDRRKEGQLDVCKDGHHQNLHCENYHTSPPDTTNLHTHNLCPISFFYCRHLHLELSRYVGT